MTVEEDLVSFIDSRRSKIVRSLQELVRIPSVTGAEKEAQNFVANHLNKIGLEVDVFEATEELLVQHKAYRPGSMRHKYHDRPNVVGVLRGSGGGRSVILNGHIDVVSPEPLSGWRHPPWSGVIEGDRLYGRGSSDMKAGITAMAAAVESVVETIGQLGGDVILQSVVEEETAEGELGRVGGTFACVARGYRADAAIIAEPTAGELRNSMDGLIRFGVSVEGKAGHWRPARGDPARGVSAVEKIADVVSAAQRAEWLRERSFNIGLLRSGEWVFTIAVKGFCEGAIGVFPREEVEDVLRRLRGFLKGLSDTDKWFASNPPKLEVMGSFPSAETDADHPLIKTMEYCHRQTTGNPLKVSPAHFGTDMYLLSRYGGTPTVMYGPGNVGQGHTQNEYVEPERVVTCAKVLALTLLRWCGQA